MVFYITCIEKCIRLIFVFYLYNIYAIVLQQFNVIVKIMILGPNIGTVSFQKWKIEDYGL